jgi:hypothetical protein
VDVAVRDEHEPVRLADLHDLDKLIVPDGPQALQLRKVSLGIRDSRRGDQLDRDRAEVRVRTTVDAALRPDANQAVEAVLANARADADFDGQGSSFGVDAVEFRILEASVHSLMRRGKGADGHGS